MNKRICKKIVDKIGTRAYRSMKYKRGQIRTALTWYHRSLGLK